MYQVAGYFFSPIGRNGTSRECPQVSVQHIILLDDSHNDEVRIYILPRSSSCCFGKEK